MLGHLKVKFWTGVASWVVFMLRRDEGPTETCSLGHHHPPPTAYPHLALQPCPHVRIAQSPGRYCSFYKWDNRGSLWLMTWPSLAELPAEVLMSWESPGLYLGHRGSSPGLIWASLFPSGPRFIHLWPRRLEKQICKFFSGSASTLGLACLSPGLSLSL